MTNEPWKEYATSEDDGPWSEYGKPAESTQVEPASPKIARPTLKEKPDGFIDSLSQGFKRSMPETKSLAYGAVGAVGGALGMDGVRDWGLENYQRVQENEVEPLAAEGGIVDAVTGDGSLGNWAGDTLGNFAGQAVQSLAVGAAGALAGGAAGSAAGGVGAVPGAALGAVGGLVARKGAKELIEKGVKEAIEAQVANGVGREAAEAAGEAMLKKRMAQAGGATLANVGLNVGQEAGISYTARAEDAEKAGEDLTQGDAVKALGFGTAAGLVDTVAEALMAGRLLDGVSVDPSMAKRMAAGMIQGAMTEGGTEAVQAVLERAGASQELTSKEAIFDYIENAAAGALGGGVGGAAGGFRRQEEDPVAGPPAAVLGLPAPDGSPGFGAVQVSPDGTATTAPQREGLANVGLTPDVIAARTQHPAATPVLADGSPIPNPAGGVLSRAVNRGVETGAVATTNPAQMAAEMAMQSAVQQAMGGQVVPQVADAPVQPEEFGYEGSQQPDEIPLAEYLQQQNPVGADRVAGLVVGFVRSGSQRFAEPASIARHFNVPMETAEAALSMAQQTVERERGYAVQSLAESHTAETMPKVSEIAQANGFDMDTANRVRREALAAQKENRNANNQSGAPDQTVDQGRESAASDGVELPAAVPAGEIGSAQAAQEPERDAAPAPVRAEPRPEAATVPQALTYSDSTDLLDDDITPPSGGAFSERGAAELMARRSGDGAKAVKIDDGWVVRKPGPQFQSGVAQPIDTGDGATDFLGDSRLAETLGAQSDNAGLIQLGADPRISAGEVDSAKTLYESVSADPQGLGNELAGVSDSQEFFRVGDAPLDASGADINPGTEQGSPGYAGTDSVLPSYSSDTQSSRTVGYEKLDGDSKSVVKARVLGGLNDPKVLQSVIELSPVQVMDVFAGEKVTTNSVRNNKSVLLDRLASAFDDPVLTPSVSSFIDAVVARHPDAFAGLAAEMKAGTSEGAGRASDNGTAVDTNAAGHTGDIGTFSQPTAGNEAKGQPTSTVDEATVRADYREAMQAKTGNKDFDWGKGAFADTLVSALNRDPKAVEQLRGWVNGGNDETLKVWAKHAGVKLPRSKQARREAIDAWAGITLEQRADSDAAKATAKQDKKDAETASRRARQPIPDFATVHEAHSWWKRRAGAWPSEGAYRATPEYAEFVEKTRPLYAEHKNERVADKKDTLAKAGLKVGDRVQSTTIGNYMTSQTHTGVIVMRAGEPWVKLDAPVTVSRNRRLHEAKVLRWTADWTKEVVAGAEQSVTPPRGQQLGRDEGQPRPASTSVSDAERAKIMAEAETVEDDFAPASPTPAQEASAAPAEPAAAIDDFGERLEGARKFMPPSLREELGDEQIASQPLSKLWPADAHVGIEDPTAAALAFAARAEVPAKPRKAFKVKRWVEQVKLLRTLPQNLENAGGLPQMEQWAARIGVRLDGFFAKVRLLAQLPRETWGRVERVGEHPGAFRYEDGKQVPAPFSTVTIDGKSHRFDVGAIGPDELQQVKELLGAEAAKKDGLTAADFEIRSYRNRDEAFISRKGGSERRPLKTFTGKDVVKQARAYLGENVAELEQAWEAVKARDNVGKADTRRDENRERVGENRRDGRDVTEQMFTDAFGFRGVQFGNWVKQGKGAKDRQGMLNEAYDALLDLADLLGIPSQAISLNGSLGLALGARGAGRASAHFERDNLVINLTKTKGAGSLAHEWFHALDNYFSRLRGTSAADPREGDYITYKPEPMLVSKMGFGTMTRAEVERRAAQHPDAKAYKIENWEPSPLHKEGVRPEVEKAFADLVAALNASPMAQRAAAIDGVKTRGGIVSGDGYWSRIIERGARAFENYVISKLSQRGWTNDFLANIRGWEQWQQLGKNRDRYPYLFPEEEAPVVQAFDAFFQMVQTKEEGGKVMLFSRIAPPRKFQPDRSEAVAFRQQFDRYTPSLLTNVPPLRVGRMPPVLRSLGVPDAIVTISRDIVRKASNKHSSERQVLRALPEELADPVAVFESNSHPGEAMVVLTEIIDQKGQPVIVAIDIRRDGSVGRISSAYGKGSAKATFENWIKNGRLLYVSDRAKENAALKGLQLPNSNPRTGKVLRETDVVNSDDSASFSRTSERAESAYSPGQVETDVADITARWVDSPPIEVVPTAADLPQDVVGELQRIGSDGSDIRGVYHPNGTIYVVRDNIISRRDLEETLFHEAVGHHGLRLMFGKGTEQQLQRLVQAAGGWGGIKAYARRHGIDLSAYDFLATDPRLRDGRAETVLMDELFAHMAERMNDLEPSLRNRIAEFLGAVRAWLRQNGFELLAGSLSDGEMAHLLRRSERAVQGRGEGLAASVHNALFSMRETGRGERFIERNGHRFVERDGAFYLTNDRGRPADFRRAEAERRAREVDGVAVKDDGLPTWSVRLPDTTARAEARASGMRFSRRANPAPQRSEEGERQFRETERAYGGRATYDRAKAAGGTKLTYEEWVRVRTPSFKSWFGDWQALRAQKRLDAMDPIKVRVPEDWRGLSHVELRDRMASALDRMVRERAEIDHPEIGVIRVGRTGARKSEGSARDPAKSLVAADIESLIPGAVYARSEPSRGGDGKDIDGYSTLLARVDVDGVPLVAAFTIRHQSDGRWYYNAVTLHDGHEKARDSYGRPDQNGSSDAPIAGLAEFVRRPLSRVNPETVSKVTDPETGEPMVVYHGTDQEGLTVFDLTEARQNADIPSFFFTTDIDEARGYGDNVIAAFLNIRNPAEKPNARMRGSEVRKELEAQGFDGTRVDDEFAAFRPEQIKSAGSNNGDFSGSNPDIRFSRRADAADALGAALNNARDVRLPAGYLLGDLLGKGDSKTLGWWHKSVGTMFNLAERSPEFKRVFDSVQRMIGDVSQYANAAMDMAPDLLPKFDSMRDWKKRPIAGESAKRVSRAVFEGTTLWTRDEDGRPVRTDDIDRAGIVWTAEELRQKFGMSPTEVGYYQQTRRAIDKSLNDTAISQMVKLAGDDVFDTRDEALAAPSARVAAMRLRDRLMEEARVQPRRASTLNETARQVMDMADKVDSLTERGYAPLSRFGRFTVYVTGDGMDPVFQMFETEREANRAARKLRGEFPRAQVEQGTLSEQQFRQFRGMTTETLELFGDILGLDATGDSAADQAFQAFLKAAKANRSAMKRLIHRQGIAGYSDDVSRVLANFIYSNARMAASNLNAGETAQAIAAIPKEQGQLKDAAIELSSYVDDPQDQGYKLGAFNFVQYLGGSIASAMVNMTQPLTMTFPWLSQYGGAWKAAAMLKDAAMLAGKTGTTGDAELDHFLKRADADGITQPQEVHQLQAYAAGKGVLRSGDGTQAGDAAAKAYNAKARVMLLWGMPFSLAEQFNRRMTFIAAFNTARDQGMQDPYGFAVHAVQTTQGVYNKANKPAWARTTLGGMAFTFKQYSINYVEMLERMWRQGGPEGKKGVMLAMAVMYLLAGAGGLPGMDDLDDLIDGVLQRMGYNFNTKQKREQFFAGIVGETGAKFLEHGVSALPGMPIDVAGRLGMGNLVPSTGLLKKKDNYGRDVAELAGPTGDFITRSLLAADLLMAGEVVGAARTVAPKALANVVQGLDMAASGQYRDAKGRKVVETTGIEAATKAIGFQPANVAKVQQASADAQQMIAFNRQRESEIAGKWAQGIVDAKQSRIDEARAELADWNAKNPENPIRINSAQIKRRVQQLRMSKKDRIAKTAPREVRAAVRAQLAD